MSADHSAGKRAALHTDDYDDDSFESSFSPSPRSSGKAAASARHEEYDEDDDYEDDHDEEDGEEQGDDDEHHEDARHDEAQARIPAAPSKASLQDDAHGDDDERAEDDGAAKERFDRALLEARLLREYRSGQQEEDPEIGRLDSLKLLGVIAAFFIVLAAGAFYAARWIGGGEDKTPVIHADDSPVRVKPAEPGGFFVDHQDKSVYEAMSGKSSEKLPQVQKILPETELPANISEGGPDESAAAGDERGSEVIQDAEVRGAQAVSESGSDEPPMTGAAAPEGESTEYADPRKAPVSGQGTEERARQAAGTNGGMGDFIDKKDAEYQEFESASKSSPRWMPKPSYDPVLNVAEGPDRTVRAPSEVKLPAAPVGKDAANGERAPLSSAELGAPTVHDNRILKKAADGIYLQIGAFRTTSDAERHMKKALSAFPGLLLEGRVNYYFQPVDLAGSGTIYRLKIGSYPNENKARKACEELTHKNIECLYARH